MNRKFYLFAFLILAAFSKAQENTAASPQMADPLRENGKIYVVVAVIAIIFVAIAAFMAYLDRSVKRLEDKMKDAQTHIVVHANAEETEPRH